MKSVRQQKIDIVRKIKEGTKTAESYGTGLATERVLVATFHQMKIKQLEQLRYILNQIIKKKKISKRINDSSSAR